MSTVRLGDRDADERRLHLSVAAAAEFGARDFVLACGRRGEFRSHRFTAVWNMQIDLQLGNGEARRAVLRSDDEPNRLAGGDLNDRRLEREPARDDLHFVNGL